MTDYSKGYHDGKRDERNRASVFLLEAVDDLDGLFQDIVDEGTREAMLDAIWCILETASCHVRKGDYGV